MAFKMPFGQSKEEAIGYIPTAEVKKLREGGKSDREIIAELKSRGHSFQSIEKAMLQELKLGATNSNPTQPNPQGKPPQMQAPPQRMPQQMQAPQPTFRPDFPTRDELVPRAEISLPPGQDVPLEMQARPVDLIEEVVEGVVEEKFEKLDTKFEFVNKGQEKLKEEMETLKSLFTSTIQKTDNSVVDVRKEIDTLKESIEDISVKCNALEKAFKQFLPDLTEKFREKHLKPMKSEEEKDELF